MRRVLFVLVAVVCLVLSASAQSSLPPPEHALIIAVRSSRQATTQAPYELRLASGARIIVAAKDVHDAATLHVRRVLETQASPPVAAAHVFVLHIQSSTPAGKAHVEVALHSGAVVRVATTDIRDPRLTFLRTALAEATALERADQHRASLGVQQEYLRMVWQIIRQNWQRSQGVAGKVTMKFVIQRDGRITDIEVKESGGELLDLASVRALVVTGQLPPMPREFPDNTLTVQFVFEYQR